MEAGRKMLGLAAGYMGERMQLVDGCMTDAAVTLSVYALSQLTPRDAVRLFKRMGAMTP
ncbi:MAG: hypothetical protein OXB95_00695 [Rhodobacteraceae bacterium]|nr:hypothetical protein [Paracoccaceae bacterium]